MTPEHADRPTDPDATETIESALAARDWMRALDRLTTAARATVKSEVNRANLFIEDLDALCVRLAAGMAADHPVAADPIGFDRPTNIHVVTEIYHSGGHRSLIDQVIASLPNERHVVLFTGALENNRQFGIDAIVKAGGFPIHPDESLDRFDRLLWLREKLATLAARRLFVFHHPDDVLAGVALAEFAPRYGRRAYVVHHADTVASIGTDIATATHLAIRPEQKRRMLDRRPGYPVHVVPLVYAPERLHQPMDAAVAARIAAGTDDFLSSGAMVTATCGGSHKFDGEGDIALARILARILTTTRGRHYHIGTLSDAKRAAIRDALAGAGVSANRLIFIEEVASVAETLVYNDVDLFLTSFPVGGGLTVMEAAYAGIPIAVYGGAEDEAGAYVSGVTHVPDEVVVWKTPDDLEEALRSFWHRDGFERLGRLAAASRRWFASAGSLDRFRLRLKAVIALVEGRHRAPLAGERLRVIEALLDRDHYARENPDVVAAGMDPLDHFLSHGERERRSPNALFDPRFYLSTLPEAEREAAGPSPATHYVMRGEAQGYAPHPLFDPAYCEASLRAAGLWRERTGDALADCVLLRYMRGDDFVTPHTFFDPAHYGRQAELVPEGTSLLVHFLETGVEDGLSPHPLLRLEWMAGTGRKPREALLDHLSGTGAGPGEPRTTPLFDPSFLPGHKVAQYANGAPNLLWSHMIEGNRIGCDPHPLVSIAHVEKMRPGVLVSATPVVLSLAMNRLGVDTHPLVVGGHLLKQAPYAESLPISLTQYFIERGMADNVDPHPLFSTQYYLYKNADLTHLATDPLSHFLRHGQYEGRPAHPAFDGNDYFQRWLRDTGGGSPLLDYVSRGKARFRPTMPMDADLTRLSRKMALSLFATSSGEDADAMLASTLHPDTAVRHPTLITEVRPYRDTAEGAVETTEIHPAERVLVDRPSVVAQTHIAPPTGTYTAHAATASVHTGATLVPGNDGFIADDGTWIDHGLRDFDPDTMRCKEHGAVVAVSDGKVLLRRYGSEVSLPRGILASGTYSHNYFHFLIEVMPRILLAADIAPEGTPILADDGMPAQHYQALRRYLPGHPVMRLARHGSVKVGRLYVGSMPNVVHDAFGSAMPPSDAVRLHPAMVRRLAALARGAARAEPGRRLCLQRVSAIRTLLNAPQIDAALSERGFDTVRCELVPFVEQVEMFSRAGGGIVGQSGAHLANMLFAPAGTRVVALFSNAPGTNFYLWSTLGALLGHDVVNVAGWRIFGTAAGDVPEAHEAFTVPVDLVTPFFPADPPAGEGRDPRDDDPRDDDDSDPVGEARERLDVLRASCLQADTLTGSWGLRSQPTPEGFNDTMIAARRALRALLERLEGDEIAGLLDHPFFTDPGGNIRSGFVALRDHDADERATLDDLELRFEALAFPEDEGEDGTGDGDAREPLPIERMLALAMLYLPAWKLPLVDDLERVEARLRPAYLRWLVVPPYLFRSGDDAGYVAFTGRLLLWLSRHLEPQVALPVRKLVVGTATGLDMGQLLLVDAPLRATLEARNRLLEQVALRAGPAPRALPRPADLSEGRIRVGIVCRTFAKGPDSEAVVAFFGSFDSARFEVFAYSMAFRDRVVAADEEFDRLFDAAIDHRRIVSAGSHDMREKILGDDLDVLLYANATTFGVHEVERALYHRVAPVQMTLNSHLPVAPGFPSFDYFLTGRSDDPLAEIDDGDYPETIKRFDGSVINYLNSFEPRAETVFDRAMLGLSDDDIVMMNGGSSQKLRSECLRTMLRALRAVPDGKLLLAPYNPGWAARSQAFAFNNQLAEIAGEVGVSMDRIVVLGELSVAEAEAAVSLSDIYLSSFPHGGATMTHLALIYGTPPVVLRRRDTRSVDQFLVSSLGFEQMLASTPDDYVELVAALARDRAHLRDLSDAIGKAARHPVFVANPAFSRTMQSIVEDVLDEARAPDGAGAGAEG